MKWYDQEYSVACSIASSLKQAEVKKPVKQTFSKQYVVGLCEQILK